VGWAFCMPSSDKKCIQNFSRDILSEATAWKASLQVDVKF
jgi:hypothetical protein